MAACGWYFSPDEFDPARQDEMVHRVRADPYMSTTDKKALILCWFMETYAVQPDGRFTYDAARLQVRKWLGTIGTGTIETWLS